MKAKQKTLHNSQLSRKGLVIFAIVFALIGGYLIFRSFAASANVYVSTNGNDSTCVRNDQTKPCATFTQAYDIAQAGDTVQVACGSYPNTYLEGNKSSGPNIIFTPASNYCVTIGDVTNGSISFSDGGSYSTWQYFNLPGGLYQGGSNFVNGLTIDHDHIAVDQQATGTINNFHLVNGLKFTNNTVGPSCCHSSSSPEGLRIGTPGGGSSTNVLIQGNLIQYTLRSCDYWPSSYQLDGQTLPAGSCPDTTCTSCHEDGIHIWGLTNSTIEDNRILGVEVQGIFIENSNGVAGLTNSNINIINNMVSVSGGSAAIYIEGNGTQPLISGTWNIAFNTTPNLIEIASYNGMAAGTVFNLTGNIGQLMNASSSGNDNGCQGQASGVTINYKYNAWLPTSGGTSGPCGTGDIGNANVTFVDALNNLDLGSGNTQASNLVPASVCTAITNTDVHGNTRPASGGSFCDAGADEFGGSSGGGTTMVSGDTNGDGHVTITDLSTVLSHFGQSGQTLSTGDTNGDGSVTIVDLSTVLSHFGQSVTSTTTPGIGTLLWGGHYSNQTNLGKWSIFGLSGGNEAQGQAQPGKALGYVATNISKNSFAGVNYSEAAGTDMLLYCADGSEADWSNYGQALTNIGNAAYQQKFITETAQYMSSNHLKGTFIDNGGMQGISEAIPKCSSNGAVANYPLYDSHHNVVMNSDSDWQNALVSFYSTIGPALKSQGYYLMANGCTASDNTGSKTKAWVARYYQYVSGVACEYYMETPGAPQPFQSTGGAAYYQNWDSWEANAEDYIQSLGIDFFGIEDSSTVCADVQNEQYTRASFLMDWTGTGNSAWLWAPLDVSNCDFWNPTAAIDTGLPSGARFQLAPGVWQRNFANSTVVINTNTSPVTVTSNGQSLTIPALDASFK